MPIQPPYVLAFVGENANGILRWASLQVLAACQKLGLRHRLIDVLDPGWPQQLTACLASAKPAFCFSFQGIGTGIRTDDGAPLWTRLDVPFITHNNDNPYHCARLHSVEGPTLYRLFGADDFLQTYTRFFKNRGFAGLQDCGYPGNPFTDRTPWKNRAHKLVFVKTGVDASALRQRWNDFPTRLRNILEDAADLALSGVDQTIGDLCEQAFRARNIDWGERVEFYFSVCSMVDFYVRARRAEKMVQALLRHDALIVGEWSHLDRSGARARFLNSLPADELNALYADSQVLINTLPCTRFGLHERILAGFFAKAVSISDTTPYLQNRLQAFPTFYGLNIDGAGFQEELDQAVNRSLHDAEIADKLYTSAARVEEQFSIAQLVQGVLECVALHEYRRIHEGWAIPAPHPPKA